MTQRWPNRPRAQTREPFCADCDTVLHDAIHNELAGAFSPSLFSNAESPHGPPKAPSALGLRGRSHAVRDDDGDNSPGFEVSAEAI
jgi:hypothetical protein